MGDDHLKIEEPIMGFAEYKSIYYPFIYENGILQLMPPSLEAWSIEKRNLLISMTDLRKAIHSNEWIGYSNISAKAHNGNNVIFYISNDSSNNNGFLSFSVLYFYEYRQDEINEKNIDGFSVTGREINYFYNPANVFETEILFEDEKISSTNVKIEREKEIVLGSYKYQGVEVTLIISAVPTLHSNSDIPLSAQSIIKFIFSESRDIEFTVNIFEQCRKFFFYICGRTNIQFDDIQVYNMKDSMRSNDGVIRMVSEHDEEELDLKRTKKVIKYEYIKEKACLLFSAIADDKIYFENLCSSIKATHSFGIDRIILNFVAFEREFRNLYSDDIVRSDEYNEIKNEILHYLETMKQATTGKKKKYVKSFMTSFGKTENKYADRMSKALSDCEEILLPFLHYNYEGYKNEMIEEISDRMNKLRNDSAHGNIDLQIEPINISDFATLENLLYAMRLKNIGVNLMDIRKSIKDLKHYNVMISKTE